LGKRGVKVPFVVVFGSQVTGRTHEWSDIDLIVVSPKFDRARRLKDTLLLWEVAAETDARIEPIPCGEKQWVEDDSSAVIEIARREGKRIEIGGTLYGWPLPNKA
jgi:predicted nucleotidyltransferase